LAGNKLPGMYEFVRKGDPAVMGITKVGGEGGVSEEMMRRPRLPKSTPPNNVESTANRMRATTPV